VKLAIRYEAPGAVAQAFLDSSAFVRGIRGPFGSGKSTVCCVDIIRRALAQRPGPDGKRRSRWAIVRNTYPELKTTTIKTWHGIVPEHAGRWIDSGPPRHILIGDDFEIEIWFLALDSPEDVKKLLSMDLTGAWINEAREVPKSILDGLTARVGRYPGQAQGGPSWFGVIMDTNPPDTDHWWYRLAEESTPDDFAFFAQPSGLAPTAENRENLPAGYYERLCSGKSEDWIKVYVRGEYGFLQDGRPVYPEYRDGTHYRAELPLLRGVPLRIGLDFGLTPAAAIGQRTIVGGWRWIDELVTEHMGARRFAEQLAQKLREKYEGCRIGSITGDPAGNQPLGDDEEKTVFKVIAAAGIEAKAAETNDWTPRREVVAKALGSIVDGDPAFLIGPGAPTLRKAMMGGYHYRRLQLVGEERYQDKPNKNRFSHIAEACQYAMLGAGEATGVLRAESTRRGPVRVVDDYQPFG
jgi:hypothetical protein